MPDYSLLVLEGAGAIATLLLAGMIYQFRADRSKTKQINALELQLAANQRTLQERTLERDQYRSIFQNAIEGIFQTTPDGHYINANLSLARIYGYSSTEELIINLADIERQLYVVPKRRTDFIRLMQQYNAVSGFESQVYRKSGDVIWISENARSVRDDAGTILYFEGTVQDITERKRAEEDLRKSEAKNRALLNLIPDTMFRLDRQGTYLDFKPATANKNRISVGETVGRNLRDLLPEEVAAQFKTAIEQALATDELQIFECQVQWNPARKCFLSSEPDDEDGLARDYEVRIVVCGEEEVLAIVRNMTERKKIERMKSEFVSIVSHELRTPLTSVRGSLGLIIGGVAGDIPPQAQSLLDIAYKNSERLVLIINDILDIEKIESGKMDFYLQPQKLMSLVEQAIDSIRSYGDQFGIQLVLQQSIPDLCVNVDGARLIQVLTNLLSNAVKFSPPAGTVTVTVSQIFGEVASRTLPRIRVAVSDRGPGISPAFQSQIFEKFAQADSSSTRQKGGTGLGLNISKAIIERLNGTIGFVTSPSEGTTFYFDLPEWHDIELQQYPVNQIPRSRVLICEDDQDIATLLSLMLQQEGFATDIACSAAAAKQLLNLATPDQPCPYIAMTVDLVLPDQSGISLIRELRDQIHTRHLPIVVVSAKAEQGREELNGSGFAVIDWLDKPIDQERLILAVRQTSQQRETGKPKILHVENDSDVLQVVAAILQDIAEITPAMTLGEAKQKLAQYPFDLLLLDLGLPDGSGLELLSCLDPQTGASLPTVIFSAQDVQSAAIDPIATTLVKSRTSNQSLVDTIKSLIQQNQRSIAGNY